VEGRNANGNMRGSKNEGNWMLDGRGYSVE